MSFRDKFRKFRSDTKSRIFQTNDENNNAHNSPPQTSSTTPDRWIHLRALLKTLERATRSLPPLKAVVTEFVECIDNHENVWHGRKEYDILCHELEGLFQALQHHCNQDISPTITTTVEALCESIRNEISDIRKIQAKGKVREYLEAERDADAVLVRYRRIQSHLQRLSVATQLNADISVWRIVDEIATDNRLKYLSPSLSACYNSAQAVELKRGPCTQGTRVDLLGQILGWIESSDSGSIYWMNGMAGTGKTTIAYSLCEELDTSYKLAASFFCSRLLPECRDVNLIIPSIAFQLARSSRPFRFVLSRVLERDPGVHTRLPHLQFDSLVSQPLLEVRSTLPENLVVVIDALDECENKESTSRILEILLTKSTNLPLKFIVSSRPEPEIRDEMLKQSNQAKSRVVLHELDRLTVQADIETYLRSALIQVQPTEDQIATLVERAGILFIYAATVVRYIAHDRFRRNPRARLVNVLSSSSASENKHREIDELYTIILRAALDDPNLDKSEREDIVQVLNSVICAQEPLTVDALSKLLKINNTDRVRTALRPLWSVLHISGVNERITTLHASFPDYMLDQSRSKQYYCNSEAHNQTFVECCFDLFRNMRPQFNICSLESSYIADSQIEGLEERIKNVISTELFYASRYWAAHICYTIGSPGLMLDLEEFISLRLLLWMEVMNLTKCTGAMPQAIRLVETWDTVGYTHLTSVCFSPDGACFASTSEHKNLRLWDTKMGISVPSSSKSHIKSIESVGFLPDGTRIISCFRDRTICIWDVESGEMTLGPLEDYGEYNLQTFLSLDGARIVSSTSQTIVFLDAVTGTGHVTLGSFTRSLDIQSVEVSPDGTCIALGSWDGIIRLLATATGQNLMVIHTARTDGEVNWVRFITFSPNGTRIAVVFDDYKLNMYDARNGNLIYGPVTACVYQRNLVGFSPDSTRIVYSTGSSLLIQDVHTGEEMLELPGTHTDIFVADLVQFSSDGSCIISSSSDGGICTWDARTGQLLLGPIKWHRDDVCSVALSPDSTRLVCGSFDDTIRVTDIQPVPAALDSSAREYREWEMREDGWVVDKLSRLLVWVPGDLRTTLIWPRTKLLISGNGSLRLNFEGAYLGEMWTECYDPTQ
ncbi:unnamed protein product [Rhizoctonia solani]|uniref:Nephrocystin 3-like N-terminal domain-containing protein n=1 Tax=Rhizoctonia solani TaxID=456999 RepID=A0A8H3HN65_9AGAM|nr:unnamed protein product [Rhizoctonia solani]CAE6531491.1 unnamed protein product [Rhizoctonia solani]